MNFLRINNVNFPDVSINKKRLTREGLIGDDLGRNCQGHEAFKQNIKMEHLPKFLNFNKLAFVSR